MEAQPIQLRGVRVHNLQGLSLDLPRGKLIAICGPSGAGKSSLAFDTLHAEGQRRYLECFAPSARQFFERFQKADAEAIVGLPPALAVRRTAPPRSRRATVATLSEIDDLLRIVWARLGSVCCPQCGQAMRSTSVAQAAEQAERLPDGTRYCVAFAPHWPAAQLRAQRCAELVRAGFVRWLIAGEFVECAADGANVAALLTDRTLGRALVVVDRLASGRAPTARIRDAFETAYASGGGTAWLLARCEPLPGSEPWEIAGQSWQRLGFSAQLACSRCGEVGLPPRPELLSANSPLGACPACGGLGETAQFDLALLVPQPQRSLAEHALAPHLAESCQAEHARLLAAARGRGLSCDAPWSELSAEHQTFLLRGDSRGWPGLLKLLHRARQRPPVRKLLQTLRAARSVRTCGACGGARLRPEALAVRLEGRSLADVVRLTPPAAERLLGELSAAQTPGALGYDVLRQARARLAFLSDVGLEYLALDRPLATLSAGEAQRAALAAALGSSLIDVLYVLDEPAAGLHADELAPLVAALVRLRARGNTVVVVTHEAAVVEAADEVVELGPGGGTAGGRLLFQGPPAELLRSAESPTGRHLSGRERSPSPERRRPPTHGLLTLRGARGRNLQALDVEFPLRMLCAVTGVSGAGKSTLVVETLYAALQSRLGRAAPPPQPFAGLYGASQLAACELVDQTPLVRGPRSNPVTYVGAFAEIRRTFAATSAAQARAYTPAHFSFNAALGGCPHCAGAGVVQVPMQFLADVFLECPQCLGRRYRPEILATTYRGRSIADVLALSVRDALGFFRGAARVQERLQTLADLGLDYLALGQPAHTLSGGEAQRLKLAGVLAAPRKGPTLLILDEPSTGLHPADVQKLLAALQQLVQAGHSLLVIEHNLELLAAADWIIDLGPGAADAGGQIVVQGTPEAIARCADSRTGLHLRRVLSGPSA